MTYFWPTWFDWIDGWDPGDDIPPGMLGLACLVGGGTAVVGGSLRGNVAITSERQFEAACRQHGAEAVAQRAVTVRGSIDQMTAQDIDAIRDAQHQIDSQTFSGGRR